MGRVWTVGCDGSAGDLRSQGLLVESCGSLAEALAGLEVGGGALLVHAALLARLSPRAVVEAVRRVRLGAPVLVWAPGGGPDLARDALRSGVADVVLDPEPEALALAAGVALEAQGEDARFRLGGMVSSSPLMGRLFDTVRRVAPTPATVLLLGETGTGKELAARAIHRTSRRAGRFVAVSCAALPDALIESELFGYERGAFTGAERSAPGLFRHADGGTLLLDEVGDLPPSAQHSLLRVLQEGAVRPVGGSREVRVDVRIVAATSRPLYRDVAEGRFREDLLYRLDVIRIQVPPLRERPEDVPFLFGHFLREAARRHALASPRVGAPFLAALAAYGWPGNVRQLENVVERLVLTRSGELLAPSHLADLLRPYRGPGDRVAAVDGGRVAPALPVDLSCSLTTFLEPLVEELERRYLDAALRESRGRLQVTAARAGLSRRTLLRKMRKYGIDKRDYRRLAARRRPVPAGEQGGVPGP